MAEMLQKFALANDTAVRYIDSLKGERCVVFIHGYLETADIWEETMQALRKKYRVIAFDVPGHGLSETRHAVHTMEYAADAMHGLFEQIGIEKCVVAGHSMGGYIALAYCKKYGGTVDGLVLFSSTPDPDTPEKKINREHEINIIESGRKEMLAKSNPGNGFANDNRDRFREKISDMTLDVIEMDDDGIVALLKGMEQREDGNPVLEAMKQPFMFVFGKKDNYMPLEYEKALAARYPKAAVVWLENSGHMGFIEEPKAAVEALEQFIDKI